MNYNNLYYFKILAEFQHYTKASKYLCITQPSLSHAIASLEYELGVTLFEKCGRNIRLNKYGQLFNSYISKGFTDIEYGIKLLKQFSKNNAGIVDFSFLFVLGSQFIPNLIKNFYENECSDNITINFNQCNTKTSINKLKNGLLDISLCTYMHNEPDVNFIPILKQELVCITSSEHPLSSKTSVSIEELTLYPIIRYIDAVGEIQYIIDHMFSECKNSPPTYSYLEEEVTMAGLVSTGHKNCIAIVPNLEILQNHNIRKMNILHSKAYRNIYLATLKKASMPSCVKLFYDFILNYVSDIVIT